MIPTNVEVQGTSYPSIAAACRAYGQEYNAVMQRISRLGWDVEEAITTPFNRTTNSKEVTLPDGSTFKSIKELCMYLGLNKNTVYRHAGK